MPGTVGRAFQQASLEGPAESHKTSQETRL